MLRNSTCLKVMANTSENRAKEISAFVTPEELYQYKVMPFGMKNSPATFQRLVISLIFNLVGCKAYINDAIIFNEEWEILLQTIRNFFDRLTVNLTKSEFCHANFDIFRSYGGTKSGKTCRSKR